MAWYWLVLPPLGGFIGWVTNRLAIRLLFRPHRPLRLLGLTFQGVIPRRREELAGSIGHVLKEQVLTSEGLAARLDDPAVAAALIQTLGTAAELAIGERLRYLPRPLARPVVSYLVRSVEQEAARFLSHGTESWLPLLLEELDVSAAVRQQLDALSIRQLESLVLELAGRELRHIELLGGVLGFVIGLAQAAVVALVPPV